MFLGSTLAIISQKYEIFRHFFQLYQNNTKSSPGVSVDYLVLLTSFYRISQTPFKFCQRLACYKEQDMSFNQQETDIDFD